MAANAEPGPTPTSATRSTSDTIVVAAEEVFGELGYTKATLGEIAERAGVSRPLVYRYHHNKEELFRTVVDSVLREWNAVLVEEADRPSPSTGQTIRRVLLACLDFAASRTVLRGILLADQSVLQELAGDAVHSGRDMLPELIAKLLAQGSVRGDIRSDLSPQDMAFVISEAFIGVTVTVLVSGDAEVGHRRVDALMETLLHGVVRGTTS